MQNHSGFMFLLVALVLAVAGYSLMTRSDSDAGGSTSIRAIQDAGKLPASKMASQPTSGSTAEVTGSEPVDSALGGLVLVKFGATWCPPCRAIDGQLNQLKSSHKGKVEVIKVDVDEDPELSAEYNVVGIPRLILFENGKKVGDKIGYLTHDELAGWVAEH